MPELLRESTIAGVRIFALEPHPDERGRFQETYQRSWVEGGPEMVQASLSYSRKDVLRGIHFHRRQADYWTIALGRCRVALVDIRRGSPTFRAIDTFEMSDEEPRGVYIPPLVAHGLHAVEDMVLSYLVSEEFDPAAPDEFGIAWNDPDLAIDWGTVDPILSDRDRSNPTLAEVFAEP